MSGVGRKVVTVVVLSSLLAFPTGYASADTDRGAANGERIDGGVIADECISFGGIEIGCDDDDDPDKETPTKTPPQRTDSPPDRPTSTTETATQTTVATETPLPTATLTSPTDEPTSPPPSTEVTGTVTETPREAPTSSQPREPTDTRSTESTTNVLVHESTTNTTDTGTTDNGLSLDHTSREADQPRSAQTTDTATDSEQTATSPSHTRESESTTNASAGDSHRTEPSNDRAREEGSDSVPFTPRSLLAGLGGGAALLALLMGAVILERSVLRDVGRLTGGGDRSSPTHARETGNQVLDRLSDTVGWLWWVFVGSRRMGSQRLLEHETRREIYTTVADAPGQSLAALARETGTARIFLRQHALVLVREGLLDRENVYGEQRYYPTDEIPTADVRHLIAVEEHEARAAILTTICAVDRDVTATTIADVSNRDSATVSHHLNRLETDGLITRNRDEQPPTISLHDDYADLITRFMG